MTTSAKILESKKFKSFAVLDFETSNLPIHRCYKVGLTELTIYGIATSEFKDPKAENEKQPTKPPPPEPPELPRVLHKLTLMINPMMMIDPSATRVTNLDNYMLEAESKFDENAANVLLSFLKHLQQPVCLVAHNGFHFDFPILKYVLERINRTMPEDVYVLDSLRAIHDIDELRQSFLQPLQELNKEETIVNDTLDDDDAVKTPETLDMRAINETTPKHSTKNNENAAAAAKRLRSFTDEGEDSDSDDSNVSPKKRLHSRRRLDFGEMTPKSSTNKAPQGKWYPPKDKYKLGNIFSRVFSENPIVAHHAEADVKTLTQIMLHYGQDFIGYAEEHARPFSDIPLLGRPNYI